MSGGLSYLPLEQHYAEDGIINPISQMKKLGHVKLQCKAVILIR